MIFPQNILHVVRCEERWSNLYLSQSFRWFRKTGWVLCHYYFSGLGKMTNATCISPVISYNWVKVASEKDGCFFREVLMKSFELVVEFVSFVFIFVCSHLCWTVDVHDCHFGSPREFEGDSCDAVVDWLHWKEAACPVFGDGEAESVVTAGDWQ